MNRMIALAATVAFVFGAGAAQAANDCPNGGTVRFGVEPYEAAPKLTPIYHDIGKLIAKQLGCKVEVLITTSYTAEIEAMRHGHLEAGEFGPFGYILAHQVADAQAVAAFGNKQGKPDTYYASVVTWPGSGIHTLKQVAGHTFAFSDPASTSGHLFPSYALHTAGIDPSTGVKAIYAGSHSASYEALVHHKVAAGELNSQQIEAAKLEGAYKASNFVTLWKSGPIPLDPITVYGKLKPSFKARLTHVLQTLDLSGLSKHDLQIIGSPGARLVPQTDAAYGQIRNLVGVLHIDLNKMN